jgi:murein DD-endopeptidase MepM/ murein hydrolase activator NlpD
MPDQKKKKQKLLDRLKIRYRMVVMRDDTFEEKLVLRLSRLNVLIVAVALSVVIIFLTTFIIAFTPLREYIPGYGSEQTTRENLLMLTLRADSLDQALSDKDEFIVNIKNILEGHGSDMDNPTRPDSMRNYSDVNYRPTAEDSMLRKEFEQSDYSLATAGEPVQSSAGSIASFFFFVPLKGIISNGYNASTNHYGIDIVTANRDDAVKATLDGTVIFSSWSLEAGNVIVIQHSSNLLSVYKHNSVLLKKQGTSVRAGEAIAIVGNTGEQTTGPHLHFELWFNGAPVNPRQYIAF